MLPITISQAIKECLNEIKKISQTCEQNLPYKAWLSLLESLLKNKEIIVKKENTNGVHVLSFNALSWVSADVVYVAGLNESLMKNNAHNFISHFDKSSIKDNMGFFLKEENPHLLHQTIQYFIQQNRKKLILSCSQFDFLGGSLTPDSLWLKWHYQYVNKKQDNNTYSHTASQLTAWDKQQRKATVDDILNPRSLSAPSVQLMEQSIKEDSGALPLIPYCKKDVKKMSVSYLNDYVSCPFVYFAKNVLELWSGPEKDDIDRPAMQKGSLLHTLFEKLKSKQPQTFLEEPLSTLIEDIKNEQELKSDFKKLHPIMWEKEKLYFLKNQKTF